MAAVVLLLPPVEAAHAAALFTGARLDGGFGRGFENREDNGSRVRRDLRGDGEPAVHVALEGEHVRCAGHAVFAGGFVGDLFGEEADKGRVDELVEAVFPDGGTVGVVVHVGGAEGKDAKVVRELSTVHVGAVLFDVGAVVDVVIIVHEPNTPHPVPRLLGPVGVRLVARVARQSCAEVEKAAYVMLGQFKVR